MTSGTPTQTLTPMTGSMSGRQGRERATEWEQSLESYVHEKPIQAVLMAVYVVKLLLM